jgi:hypothetical protein
VGTLVHVVQKFDIKEEEVINHRAATGTALNLILIIIKCPSDQYNIHCMGNCESYKYSLKKTALINVTRKKREDCWAENILGYIFVRRHVNSCVGGCVLTTKWPIGALQGGFYHATEYLLHTDNQKSARLLLNISFSLFCFYSTKAAAFTLTSNKKLVIFNFFFSAFNVLPSMLY